MLGLLLLIQSSRVNRRQTKRDELRLVALLAERWEGLRTDFQLSIMRARGTDAYYTEVDATDRALYRELVARGRAADEELRQALGDPQVRLAQAKAALEELSAFAGRELGLLEVAQMWAGGWPDPEFAAEAARVYGGRTQEPVDERVWEELNEVRAELTPYRVATRRVLRFLGEVSGLILRGLVSPDSVYEALGVELVRQGGAIRILIAEREMSWTSVQPGLALRILILIDIMWARGSRLGELATQPSPEEVAQHKKTSGSGKKSRERTYKLARQLGSPLNAWKLRLLLRHAESPAAPIDWQSTIGLATGDPNHWD